MSIRHLPKPLQAWYMISVDRDGSHRRILHHEDREVEASAEWAILGKHSHGYGIRFGRNGGESHAGLDVYVGRIGSLWLRLRCPWTAWLKVKDRERKDWYQPRHTTVHLHPFDGAILTVELDCPADTRRGWRHWTLTWTDLLGRRNCETVEGATGMAAVPLPEGNYSAMWTEEVRTWGYARFPGTLLDRLRGPMVRRDVNLDIAGGIPVEGKGENSWDCGMDGLFGCSGPTVQEAVGNAVRSVLRDRERHGGPHNLTAPTSVADLDRAAGGAS